MSIRFDTDEDYWEYWTIRFRARLPELNWPSACKELRAWAERHPPLCAFVIGTGPSFVAIRPEQWLAMERWLTIGVNYAEAQIHARAPEARAPTMTVFTDRACTQQGRLPELVESMKRTMARGGKVLVGTHAAADLPHTWAAPIIPGPPAKLLEFGLTTTAQKMIRFPRTAVAAAHLALLLGFRNVCLVGVDHGADYGAKGECEGAAVAWGNLAAWSARCGLGRLWQCGAQAGFDAPGIKKKDLAAALKGVWLDLNLR
jgi:hypothetical protein